MSLINKFRRMSDEEYEKLNSAQKLALEHLTGKIDTRRKIKRIKYQLETVEWRREQSNKKLENAKKELKKYENNEAIILQMAGIPTKAVDRKNRIQAINRYFDLLNLLADGDVGGKPFSALYNQIRPVTLLFDYVAECAFYDKESRCICINGKQLYLLVKARIEEQNRLKSAAEKAFAEMEKKTKR